MPIHTLAMANMEIFQSIESIDKMNDIEYAKRGSAELIHRNSVSGTLYSQHNNQTQE
jgi:hypothetical protein